jgi:hypothetical protein
MKAMKNKGLKRKSGPSNVENVVEYDVFAMNTLQEMKNIYHLLVWLQISK